MHLFIGLNIMYVVRTCTHMYVYTVKNILHYPSNVNNNYKEMNSIYLRDPTNNTLSEPCLV